MVGRAVWEGHQAARRCRLGRQVGKGKGVEAGCVDQEGAKGMYRM